MCSVGRLSRTASMLRGVVSATKQFSQQLVASLPHFHIVHRLGLLLTVLASLAQRVALFESQMMMILFSLHSEYPHNAFVAGFKTNYRHDQQNSCNFLCMKMVTLTMPLSFGLFALRLRIFVYFLRLLAPCLLTHNLTWFLFFLIISRNYWSLTRQIQSSLSCALMAL